MGSVVKAIGNAKFHQGRVHGHSGKLHNGIIKYRIRFKLAHVAIRNSQTQSTITNNLNVVGKFQEFESPKLESWKLQSTFQ